MSKEHDYKLVEVQLDPIDLTYPEEVAEAARQALEENPLNIDAKYRLAIALGQLENVEEALPLAKELYEHNPEQHLPILMLLLGCANVHERYDLIEKMEQEFAGDPLYTEELEIVFEKALTPIEDNPFKLLKSKSATTIYSGFDDPKVVDLNCFSHQEGSSRLDCCDGEDDRDLYPSLNL